LALDAAQISVQHTRADVAESKPIEPLLPQWFLISSTTPNKPQTVPSPGTTTLLRCQTSTDFYAYANLNDIHPQQSSPHPYPTSTDTSIPSTQLPNTSLTFAITDAIGSSKSHCYVLPLIWDLIEAKIKGKG
jgi:hypothetical protein